MSTVGVYAGAFDPVHKGHIAFAEEALRLGLERVVLLPERMPRHKPGVTDFAHRVAMLRLAVAGHPQIEVTELPDEQFTVGQTLPELKTRFGSDLALLMGSDVAKTLPHWEDVDKLLLDMALVVALRGHTTQQDVETALQLTGQTVRFRCIPSPALHVASAVIRRDGGQQRTYLDPKVAAYASKHKLYG